MQPLPGWVYILVGAVVSGFSWFVRSQTGSKVMLYFFFIGFIFLIIGVAKLALVYFKGKKDEDLAALNMQDSINKAARQQGQSPYQSMGQQMGQQRPMQYQQGQQTQPGQQVPQVQQGQQGQQRPMQPQSQSSPGGLSASQLFPYKGVKYDARPPQGQHIVQQQGQQQAQASQQNPGQQQQGQQPSPNPGPGNPHRIRNTPFDSPDSPRQR